MNLATQALLTRRAALRAARMMGCSGAHWVEGGWLPCETPEELEALLEGGVELYRQIREKGLLGRTLGELRQGTAGRVPKVGGGRVSGAIKKRVRYDPSAVDADGDGFVQDNTTAERRVGRAVEAVSSTGKRVRSVASGRSTPKTSIERVRPSNPSRRSAIVPLPKKRAEFVTKKAAQDSMSNPVSRSYFTMGADEIDSAIKRLGGVGRARTTIEGPLPAARRTMDHYDDRLEAKYGRLVTLADHEQALQSAFPNAKVSLSEVLVDDKTIEGIGANLGSRKFRSEESLSKYFDKDKSDHVPAAIRGFSKALLISADNDPDLAKQIGQVALLQKDVPSSAEAGVGVAVPLKSQIVISFNPSAVSEQMNLSEDRLLLRSRHMAAQMDLKDQYMGTDLAQGLSNHSLSDSDAEMFAAQIGFHEWAHVRGITETIDSEDKDFISKAQQWVKDGKPFSGGENLMSLTDEVFDAFEQAFPDVTPEHVQVAKRMFAALGYPDVDMSNQAELRAVYRALALRIHRANAIMDDFDARTESISVKDWRKFNGVSGYGNSHPEEGIAELFGLQSMHPDFAISSFRDAYSIPEVAKRMS